MGILIYGPTAKEIRIEDRTLAHLQVVIIAKLRRGESFAFTWEKSTEDGSGHTTVWVHPGIAIEFVFAGSRRIPLNRAWVEDLMRTANNSSGLELVVEPDSPVR